MIHQIHYTVTSVRFVAVYRKHRNASINIWKVFTLGMTLSFARTVKGNWKIRGHSVDTLRKCTVIESELRNDCHSFATCIWFGLFLYKKDLLWKVNTQSHTCVWHSRLWHAQVCLSWLHHKNLQTIISCQMFVATGPYTSMTINITF